MRRHWPQLFSFLFCAMLAMPAAAQGVRWQQDLEAAKSQARQSGRLVLVHFWTPECAPCLALEQQVFNQPGVSGAIEAQFVPVKLDANENSATAQGFGISRVPTDVIITPDGAVVGKLISPPTPSAYVAEVTQVAGEYSAKLGSPFAKAAGSAPMPSQINSAYANLALAPNTQPAAAHSVVGQTTPALSAPPVSQPVISQPAMSRPIVTQPTFSQNSPPVSTVSMGRAAQAPLAAEDHYAAPAIGALQPPATPPRYQGVSLAPQSPQQSPVANPHIAAVPVAPVPVASPQAAFQPAASTLVPLVPAMTVAAQQPQQPQQLQQPQQPLQQPATYSAAAPSTLPDPKLLPPGAPPLGFDGYCAVSMRNSWKWVPGDPRWGIVHRGRTYWFVGQNEQQQFWSDPDRYSPALSGMDPVMQIDHQQQVPGKREHSIDYDNLFYLFCSEATLQQFTANPERYAVGVREAMGIPRGRLVR